MSESLCNAAFARAPYLHSPIDDLYAFLNVTTFVTVMHVFSRGNYEREPQWQEKLYDKDGRHTVLTDFKHPLTFASDGAKNYRPLVLAMYKIIAEWGAILHELDIRMATERIDKNEVLRNQLIAFEKYAYHGVLRMLKVVATHREELMQRPPLSPS